MNHHNESFRTKHYLSIKRNYFDMVFLPAFETVEKNISCIEKKMIIAGKNILLKFYTPALIGFMTDALNHHDGFGDAAPDATIHLFDSTHTGAAFSAPWINKDHHYPLETNTQPDEADSFAGVYWYDETLNLYDPKNHQAFFWTHNAAMIPNWVGASPLRGILHWILSEYNTHLLHGAVVGDENHSILLTAKSGSGKSTTALACLLDGMDYTADDYCAVSTTIHSSRNISTNSVTAYNLYNSVKVLPDGFQRFPELHDYPIWNKVAFENGTDVKAFLFMNNNSRHHMKNTATLSAIFIPKITGGETRIVPTSKTHAMLALIPSTLFQLPLPGKNKTEDLKKIIDGLPCYTLELGPNVRQVPKIIRDFLRN